MYVMLVHGMKNCALSNQISFLSKKHVSAHNLFKRARFNTIYLYKTCPYRTDFADLLVLFLIKYC